VTASKKNDLWLFFFFPLPQGDPCPFSSCDEPSAIFPSVLLGDFGDDHRYLLAQPVAPFFFQQKFLVSFLISFFFVLRGFFLFAPFPPAKVPKLREFHFLIFSSVATLLLPCLVLRRRFFFSPMVTTFPYGLHGDNERLGPPRT